MIENIVVTIGTLGILSLLILSTSARKDLQKEKELKKFYQERYYESCENENMLRYAAKEAGFEFRSQTEYKLMKVNKRELKKQMKMDGAQRKLPGALLR